MLLLEAQVEIDLAPVPTAPPMETPRLEMPSDELVAEVEHRRHRRGEGERRQDGHAQEAMAKDVGERRERRAVRRERYIHVGRHGWGEDGNVDFVLLAASVRDQ